MRGTRFFLLYIITSLLCFSECSYNEYNDIGNVAISPKNVTELGGFAYTAKTLGGMFFSEGGHLYLFGGTEVTEGSNAQVFLYSIDDDKIVFKQHVEDTRCILSFCEIDDEIYFATIGVSSYCQLLSFNKSTNKIDLKKKLPGKGIYAMDYDSNSGLLYIAISDEPQLYSYSISTGDCTCLLKNFTDSKFIRSMTFYGEICYLGIGSNADLIMFNVRSGEYKSLLPEIFKSESFVYSQSIMDKRLYILMSPSYKILTVCLDAEYEFTHVANYRDDNLNNAMLSGIGSNWIDINGDILFVDESNGIVRQLTHQGILSYHDETSNKDYFLDTSLNLYCYQLNKKLWSRDLSANIFKDYIIPIEFLAYNGVIYAPGRRFVVWDLKTNKKSSFVLNDEPQASVWGGAIPLYGKLCTMFGV